MTSNEKNMEAVEYVKKKMPLIGFGTYQVRGESLLGPLINEALRVGYRFFDTAQIYRNEGTLGKIFEDALGQHGLTREDIFITTKISPANQGTDRTRKSFLKSLSDLRTEYVDLVLIHWPGTSRLRSEHADNAKLRAETYKVLEEMYDEGKTRSIGVSNYEIRHLESLLSECRVHPSVNQCELHPHLPNKDLVKYCKEHNIHFQSYSTLGGPDYSQSVLADPTVSRIASVHGATPAQVALAWALHQGLSVLPRTTNIDRVGENYGAKDVHLTEEEMKDIDAIGINHRTAWDPQIVS